MRRHIRALVVAACLLSGMHPLPAAVTLESFSFPTEAEAEHFRELLAELRCLVCQNQSLADSDAELAHDLRAEVYEMLQEGRTDAEIAEFLVARYGDFVLYKPPLKRSTYLLWFGPFLLLGLAAFLLLRAVRRQKQVAESEISAEERARLDNLLGDTLRDEHNRDS
jgi:cytochrome c-type biogenesis protein CcmH